MVAIVAQIQTVLPEISATFRVSTTVSAFLTLLVTLVHPLDVSVTTVNAVAVQSAAIQERFACRMASALNQLLLNASTQADSHLLAVTLLQPHHAILFLLLLLQAAQILLQPQAALQDQGEEEVLPQRHPPQVEVRILHPNHRQILLPHPPVDSCLSVSMAATAERTRTAFLGTSVTSSRRTTASASLTRRNINPATVYPTTAPNAALRQPAAIPALCAEATTRLIFNASPFSRRSVPTPVGFQLQFRTLSPIRYQTLFPIPYQTLFRIRPMHRSLLQ